jgi:hypothetical protein
MFALGSFRFCPDSPREPGGGQRGEAQMYRGAIEAFDRAVVADPGFALAHIAKAHALLERGELAAARASMAVDNSLVTGVCE